jgi:formate-dependent nitrite reductase cytochrome c552 subunit
MKNIKTIEKLSKKYSMSSSDFIKIGSSLAIKEKKRELQIEKLEILARYSTKNIGELKTKIEQGIVPEHPAWEDYIELKNIEAEIKELDSDIRTLQEA